MDIRLCNTYIKILVLLSSSHYKQCLQTLLLLLHFCYIKHEEILCVCVFIYGSGASKCVGIYLEAKG